MIICYNISISLEKKEVRLLEIIAYVLENLGFPLLVAILAIYIERYINQNSNDK